MIFIRQPSIGSSNELLGILTLKKKSNKEDRVRKKLKVIDNLVIS
jgi:hypothetical protein